MIPMISEKKHQVSSSIKVARRYVSDDQAMLAALRVVLDLPKVLINLEQNEIGANSL